ncbi:hypothetical protein ABW20_dc0101251 [Dactylellina cionopaga]|nr:hypothetical protein ABW20_dc0101251 [Dactylellina cionopaga]
MGRDDEHISFFDANPTGADDTVENLSDDELSKYIIAIRVKYNWWKVIRISKSYVSKRHAKTEINDVEAAIDFAVSLGVRTPCVKRVVQGTRPRHVECVQPYVLGETSMDLWPRIDETEVVRIAFQLRSMLKKMHTETSESAGALHTGECRSFWIDEDECGLPDRTSTAEDIASVVNFSCSIHDSPSQNQEQRKSISQPAKMAW